MIVSRARAAAVTAATAVQLTGCYTFTRSTPDEVAPPMDVQVRVTATEAERLEEVLPLDDARVVQGKVADRRDGRLFLNVTVRSELRGARVEGLTQTVDIPLTSIVDVERRHFNQGRTSLLIGGAVALLAGLFVSDAINGGDDNNEPVGPGDVESRIPLFRFRVPF